MLMRGMFCAFVDIGRATSNAFNATPKSIFDVPVALGMSGLGWKNDFFPTPFSGCIHQVCRRKKVVKKRRNLILIHRRFALVPAFARSSSRVFGYEIFIPQNPFHISRGTVVTLLLLQVRSGGDVFACILTKWVLVLFIRDEHCFGRAEAQDG